MAPMNFKLLVLCFISISTAHYFLFAQVINKEPKPIHKPKYQKVSLQMATYKEPIIEKPKEIKPEPKKIEEIKEVIKKPIIKKKAIKKVAKKKPVKKIIKKPKIIKKTKKVKLKKIEKKIIKKPIEKPVVKPIVKKIEKKEIKKVNTVNKAQSLQKYKQHKQTYLTKLRAKIDRNKKYPSISRRLKEQGVVSVSFRVLKNGLFENIKVSKGSGKRRLDKAAIKALEQTNHFHSFPKEIKDDFLDITLQIAFKLK